MSKLRFDGEVAVITGAGGGLGAAYARDLAARGTTLVLNDLPPADGATSAARTLLAELRDGGAEAALVEHDVVTGTGDIVAEAVKAFGRLDVVIANAGISSTPWNSGRSANGIHEVPPEAFDKVADTSFKASARIAHHAWPHLQRTGGRLVLTTSGSVFGVQQSASYISAKAALIGLTRTLAMDGHPDGVRVNAIMPIAWSSLFGNIPGDPEFMERMEASFGPEKIASVVTWLVHRSCVVSGETISAGGGFAGRVLLGVTPGWVGDGAEGFAEHATEVLDGNRGAYFPGDACDDLNYKVARALGGVSVEIPQLRWPAAR